MPAEGQLKGRRREVGVTTLLKEPSIHVHAHELLDSTTFLYLLLTHSLIRHTMSCSVY
jgi:hypothetical protein